MCRGRGRGWCVCAAVGGGGVHVKRLLNIFY